MNIKPFVKMSILKVVKGTKAMKKPAAVRSSATGLI
jgi:hypothetical protein